MSATRGGTTAKPSAGWRAVDLASGGLVYVCPRCWPDVAAEWRRRRGGTVRRLAARPRWARCGVCDPEDVC